MIYGIVLGELNVARKLDRITINPAIMNGQPSIRGMRLIVRRLVEAAALYPDRDELKREYPELEDKDIAQAIDFATRNLDDQIPSVGSGVIRLLLDPGAATLHGRIAAPLSFSARLGDSSWLPQ
jgi:uncharacterized protein (DUF433 family)